MQVATPVTCNLQLANRLPFFRAFLRNGLRFSTSSGAMSIRKSGIWVIGGLILILGGGCKKSDATDPAAGNVAKPAAQNTPAATIHWIGMGRLITDTNAAGFLKVWGLPETERLKAQTLDKLALAPWGLPGTNKQATIITNYSALVRANHSASLLRLILEDLVQVEWYLEVKEASAQSGQLALAVRLKPGRAGVWETNLGAVFESLAGGHRALVQSGASVGWEIHVTNTPATFPAMARHAQFIRSGHWTILGLAPEQNAVFTEVLTRVQGGQEPFPSLDSGTDWLQTALDLRRLSTLFSWGWDLPQDWPRITLALNGDGKNVVTRGHLNFSKPLPEIEPWQIPTNLFHEPIHSFTAVQSLKPWLASLPEWQNLHAGTPPNQLFCWAQAGSPFLDYAAAPLADAKSAMAKIGPAIMDRMNPMLATNRMGQWERDTNSDGLMWERVPILFPFIKSVEIAGGHYLLGGLSHLSATNTQPPKATLQELLSKPNVVYFDREITGPRNEASIYLSQLFRIIFRRAQLPAEGNALAWLKASGQLLGNSATTVTKTAPTELSLARTSTIGLTAFELQVLADWLDSSHFPFQPHTVVAKLPPLPPRRAGVGGSQSSPR